MRTSDVGRNSRRTLETVDRYFAGNGLWTSLFSPVNLFIDLLCLPHRNNGIFKLTDLPKGHQKEINEVIDAAYSQDVIGQLDQRLGDNSAE